MDNSHYKYPIGRGWSSINWYLGGMDVPIPVKPEYTQTMLNNIKTIEKSAEKISRLVGAAQLKRNIKN